MIKRINEINNIGAFGKGGCGAIDLEKIVLVYGGNTRGKTTFCDIMRSLKNKDSSIVEKRKRIFKTEKGSCSVKITGKDNKLICYSNESWQYPSEIEDNILSFQIFDINFVNDNVFTNFNIEHKNKESLTQFVLGESGASLAKILEAVVSNITTIKQKIKDSKTALKNATNYELDEFKKYKFASNYNDYDSICLGIISEIKECNSRRGNIDAIKNIDLVTIIKIEHSIDIEKMGQLIEFLKANLVIDFGEIKNTYNKRKEEINQEDFSDDWVRTGLRILKTTGERCPFCGKEIKDNSIVNNYLEYFSDTIKAYLGKIEENIKCLNNNKIYKEKTISNILKSSKQLSIIKPYLEEEKSKATANALEQDLEDLEGSLNVYSDEFIKLSTNALKALNNKKNHLESSTDFVLDFNKFKVLWDDLHNNISGINIKLGELNNEFVKYQTNLSIASLDKKIEELKTSHAENEKKFLRGKNNQAIKDLFEMEETEKILSNKSKEIREKIDETQSSFIDRYFETIQEFYKSLGSCGYKIEREDVSRGKKKVYGINLYFNDVLIKETRFVMSESDRRALALAIFLAKIKVDANPCTTVILDDPITSFDKDRMRNFGVLIKQMQNDCYEQLIMLMHYDNYFKQANKLFENKTLLKIECEGYNHKFILINDDNDILQTNYEKKYNAIIDFILRKTNNFTENDARIFMETYLKYQFAYQHKQENIYGGSLNEFIENLYKRKLISLVQYNKFLIYKGMLNDTSHSIDSYSEEDKRSFVKEFYEFLIKIK
jgi:wobble nucleotide-excising tRNase